MIDLDDLNYDFGLKRRFYDQSSAIFFFQLNVGDYAMDRLRGRPVVVVSKNSSWFDTDWQYRVEDVLTGRVYRCKDLNLGVTLSEMEVIAAAARIESDG